MFGSAKDKAPAKVRAAGLAKWYDGLSEQDRVRLGRYLDFADPATAESFLTTVAVQAVEDHNYAFAETVTAYALRSAKDPGAVFDLQEQRVLALFNLKDYDGCLAACDAGLALLKQDAVMARVRAAHHGALPQALNCRNYKLNVAVGIHYDYDEGDRILDQFVADGLIDAEECSSRKQSIKIFRLQKTFDGIFALKETDRKDQ